MGRLPAYRIAYEGWYEFFHVPGRPFTCFYCGERGTDVDHCPPISRVDDYRSFGLKREEYLKVFCCSQCNSILGDTLQDSIIEREMCLKRRLEEKYQKLLKMPNWRPADIRALGRNLRTTIKNSLKQKAIIERRIDYGDGINAYINKIETQDPYSEILDDGEERETKEAMP